jgi:hypothetical protein
VGWKEGMGEGWSVLLFFPIPFLLFPFQSLTQKPFQKFKKTFNHTINQKAHAFNMMHNHLVFLN